MSDNVPSQIPETPIKNRTFNLGRMIERRELAAFVFQICDAMAAQTMSVSKRHQYLNMSSLFQGILTGYDDWFKELRINEAVFKMVAKSVDYAQLRTKAVEMVEANIPSSLVEIPDGAAARSVSALKAMFDMKLRGLDG